MMPTVPRYDVPTVSPENIPDIRGYATSQTFGAGIGQGISSVGSAITNAGDMLAANAIRMQQLENQADADVAMTNWVPAQGELDTKFHTLEGKARSEAYPDYVKKTKELREQFRSGLKNREAQRLFDNETRRLAAYSIRNAASATATGLKQYNTQANQSLITTATASIQANPASDAVYNDALQLALRGVEQEGQNRTQEPGQIQQSKDEIEQTLLTERIVRLADNDPAAAQKLYEKNKSKIFGTNLDKINSAVNAGRQKAGSEAAFLGTGMDDKMEADLASRRATGVGVPGVTFETIKPLRGKIKAQQHEHAQTDAGIYYRNTENLTTMSEDEMQTNLRRLAPVPGVNPEDYARAQGRYEAVSKAYQDQINLRRLDPAKSVEKNPAIQDILKNVDIRTPEGFNTLMQMRLAVQEQAGIPASQRTPATNAETAPLMVPLQRAVPGNTVKAAAEVAESFQKKFGKNWDKAMSHALFAGTFSVDAREDGMKAINKLLRDQPLTRDEGATLRTNTEGTAAARAINPAPVQTPPNILIPSGTYVDEMGIEQPLAPTIKSTKTHADRVLETYPSRTK